MKKYVLFLETEDYYQSLGLKTKFSNISAEFGGLRFLGPNLSKKLKKFDAVICTIYHSDLARYITYRANQLGVQTVLVSDGIFEWGNALKHPKLIKKGLILYHPIIQDVFLCIGRQEKMYFENNNTTSIPYLPERVLSLGKKQNLPAQPRLLITTANTPYFNEEEFDLLASLITNVEAAAVHLNLEYQFRLFDKKLIQRLDVKSHQNDIKHSFEETLTRYSCVITTPSSIVISSMYHNRAVGQMLYRDSPMFLHSGWQILPNISLISTLSSMIKLETNRMLFQTSIIKEYIDSPNNSDYETALTKALTVQKKQFSESSRDRLLESRLNFNIEYSLRTLSIKLKSSKALSHFYKKLKSLFNRTSI